MLHQIHERQRLQLLIGFLIGVIFGFLLHKGGITRYDVIIGQLLLEDFTVLKIMITAIITGKLGIHVMAHLGIAELHPKPGSIGSSILGGLIFGIGFGLLGYCPGTIAGAVGQGSGDAIFGGIGGIIVGMTFFAGFYPRLAHTVLAVGNFGELTIPQKMNVSPWIIAISVAVLLSLILFLIHVYR
ncbi:MAG TPA: YeeE/YedE family protein [Deltaproteobacteria bacterium]|nr:YeeE/YedE family protein [Deltaproteobacteria bacterium]